ncbi:MAG: VWA domain-containing protein [Blastocatellales bacterium]|nr:VWA domain-containing protein [Blastocatellales bacterium]
MFTGPHRRHSTTGRRAPRRAASAILLCMLAAGLYAAPYAIPYLKTASAEPRQHASETPPGNQTPTQTPTQTPAQTPAPAPQEPVVRIATELVQIDFVVTNREGKLVGGLGREDFELLEDGRPQQISHFAVGTASRPAAWITTPARRTPSANNPGSNSAPVPVEVRGRHIVLLVDDFHLAPENLSFAKRTLERFLREQMAAGDQVAIAATSGTIGLFQQFTDDRTILERAINRLSVQQRSATTPFDVPRITDYQAELIDLGDPDALELAVQELLRLESPQTATPPQPGGGGGGGGAGGAAATTGGMSPRERAAQQARSRARQIVAENANYTNSTLIAVEGTVRNLRELPGRKLVVLLSDGFFLGGTNNARHLDIRRITDAATRAGVVIYSIDARGLYATTPAGDASQPSGIELALPGARSRIESSGLEAQRDGLNALARDTGGFPVFNNNNLSLALERILADNETYYVIAWEPEQSYRDGRFRKIEVRLPNHRDLKVRTRKGYFAPDDRAAARAEARAATRARDAEKKGEKAVLSLKEEEIRKGLSKLFPLREIPVEFAADFVDTEESGSIAVITAQIDAATLRFTAAEERLRTTLDIVTVVFDERGKIARQFSDKIDLNLPPAVHERIVRRGFTYRKIAQLKPGFYQARIAVREEATGQMGSATRWVEVTDTSQKKLTLSSLMLTTAEPPAQAETASEPAGYEPRPTQASRRFSPADSIDFLIFAYNAKVDKGRADLVVQSQVFAGSKLIYSTPLVRIPADELADPLRIPYAARLSLQGFEPGDYELRLLVIDRFAKTTADRRVNFSIAR